MKEVPETYPTACPSCGQDWDVQEGALRQWFTEVASDSIDVTSESIGWGSALSALFGPVGATPVAAVLLYRFNEMSKKDYGLVATGFTPESETVWRCNECGAAHPLVTKKNQKSGLLP